MDLPVSETSYNDEFREYVQKRYDTLEELHQRLSSFNDGFRSNETLLPQTRRAYIPTNWTMKQKPDIAYILSTNSFAHMCKPETLSKFIQETNKAMLKQDKFPDTCTEKSKHRLKLMQSSDKNFQVQESQISNWTERKYKQLQDKSLQQLSKLEKIRLQLAQEKEMLHTNEILNIPNVRNRNKRNAHKSINSHNMVTINLNDLNILNEQENESDIRTVLKVEQQVQTDLPPFPKRQKCQSKFEIKTSINDDGTTFFNCPECNLAFANKTDIHKHQQAHLEERKYQCEICPRRLKRKEHLDQHMRGHSNERPFKCDFKNCDKAFKRNEHLTRHRYAIHSDKKNFVCSTCQKAFSRKDHLKKHRQTHLSDRKSKTKEISYYVNQNDTARFLEKKLDRTMPEEETTYNMKDSSFLEATLLQQLQNNPALLNAFSFNKEGISRNENTL